MRAEAQGVGVAIGIVSAHSGAGVTHVQQLLSDMLNENEKGSAIAVDCLTMRGAADSSLVRQSNHNGVKPVKWNELVSRSVIGRYQDRIDQIEELKRAYSYVLLDCHSLKAHTDVLGMAKALDGIIVVVEADRTTKTQLSYLVRSIEEYGGRILGHVLNKRIYPIPAWLNSKMERMGI